MTKKKVYICFDYDHDLEIKNALVAQAKNEDSPFEIKDMSIKQAISSNWKNYARQKIKECDIIVVLCGKYTDTASGVSAELTITQEEKKPYFLLAGHKNSSIKPKGALSTDKIYSWTWENLKLLINGAR